jgi:hypothetical protein
MKNLALLAISLIVSVGCRGGCITEILPTFEIFIQLPDASSQPREIPTTAQIDSISFYYRDLSPCTPNNPEITPKDITYYNGTNVIGSTKTNGKITWNITPGKNGVPLTGSGTLEIYAINNENGDKSRVRMVSFTIKP